MGYVYRASRSSSELCPQYIAQVLVVDPLRIINVLNPLKQSTAVSIARFILLYHEHCHVGREKISPAKSPSYVPTYVHMYVHVVYIIQISTGQDIDPAENLIKSAKPLSVESQADLHDIIRYGDISQLREALKKKYNPLDKDVNSYTALHIAALYGKLELMKHLIEEEQLYLTVQGPKKATPLIVAAGNGNLSIVKYLIEEQHIDPSAGRDEDENRNLPDAC